MATANQITRGLLAADFAEQERLMQEELARIDAQIAANNAKRLADQQARNQRKIAELEAKGQPYDIINGMVMARPVIVNTARPGVVDTTPLVSRDAPTPAAPVERGFLPESMRPPENTEDYILGIVNKDIPVDLKYDANKDGSVTREDIKPFIRNQNYTNIRNELETQYNNLVSYDPRLAYQGRASDLPAIFNQQAAQLADAGVSSIANLEIKGGGLINRETGRTVTTSNLNGLVRTDRDTGVQKWGDIFSGVEGGANYGIQALEDGSVVLFPAWEKTKSPIAQIGLGSLEKYITPILTVAGAYFGAPQLGGALGGAVGGAAGGAAIGNTAGQLLASGEIDWEQVALSAATAGAGQYVSGLLSGGEAAAGEAAGTATGTGISGGGLTSEEMRLLKGTAAYGEGATAAQIAAGAAGAGVPASVGALDLPSYGLLDETTFPQDGISTTIPPGGADMGVAQGITVVPPATPGGAATIAGLEAPGLSSMGGAQGITVPIQGGGVVSELGFIPPGATPSLGDPGSFINNPDYLGSPVISEDYVGLTGADMPTSGISTQGVLDAMQAGASLVGGQPQPQPYQSGYGAGRQMAGVDASGLLALLQGRAGVPGVAGLLAPVVNPYSLLG